MGRLGAEPGRVQPWAVVGVKNMGVVVGLEGDADVHSTASVPILVTSRMTSRRLPGKALCLVSGKPLLRWVFEAASASRLSSRVVVATSTDPTDQAIREWCQAEQVEFTAGSLQDVLKRLEVSATELSSDAIVRISGDSPLLDPLLIDYAIQLFRNDDVDVATNVQTRTFPKGQSVEVIRTDFLRQLASRRLSQSHREHVTSAVYAGVVPARVRNFTAKEQAPEFFTLVSQRGIQLASRNLSVDTVEDVASVDGVIRALQPMTPWQAGWVRCTESLMQVAAEGQ